MTPANSVIAIVATMSRAVRTVLGKRWKMTSILMCPLDRNVYATDQAAPVESTYVLTSRPPRVAVLNSARDRMSTTMKIEQSRKSAPLAIAMARVSLSKLVAKRPAIALISPSLDQKSCAPSRRVEGGDRRQDFVEQRDTVRSCPARPFRYNRLPDGLVDSRIPIVRRRRPFEACRLETLARFRGSGLGVIPATLGEFLSQLHEHGLQVGRQTTPGGAGEDDRCRSRTCFHVDDIGRDFPEFDAERVARCGLHGVHRAPREGRIDFGECETDRHCAKRGVVVIQRDAESAYLLALDVGSRHDRFGAEQVVPFKRIRSQELAAEPLFVLLHHRVKCHVRLSHLREVGIDAGQVLPFQNGQLA